MNRKKHLTIYIIISGINRAMNYHFIGSMGEQEFKRKLQFMIHSIISIFITLKHFYFSINRLYFKDDNILPTNLLYKIQIFLKTKIISLEYKNILVEFKSQNRNSSYMVIPVWERVRGLINLITCCNASK